MNLIRELNRRNVTRVALLYLLAAWLLIQVAETVLPLFEVPEGVLRGLIVLLVLGFVPALVFAWVFELTPDGLKLDRDADVSPETRRRTGNRLDIAALIVAALTVGLMLYDRMVPAPGPTQPVAAVATPSTTAAADPPAARSVPPAPDRDAITIAVLPFVNMSPDPDNAYFAEGVAEEILNLLSRVPRLQVVGRTSSFRFRDSDEDLPSIGQQLGASHLLEGSVRKAEDRVRITAQLVQASDGVRLWSDSWDRSLENIFAVQDEIGREVTAALRNQLAATVAPPSPLPTTDPEGYADYLRARALLADRGAANMHQAVELLERTLEIDPDYAPAHAVLAQVLSLLPIYDFDDPAARAAWIDRAIRSAERAIEIDPDLAMAWSALGSAQAFHRWDWTAAREAFDRALALAPADAEIVNLAGDLFRILKNVGRARELEAQAVRLDPLRAFNHSDLAHALHLAGDCALALESAQSAYALDPTMPYSHLELVLCNGELGRIDAMRAAVEQARIDVDPETYDFLMLDFWLAMAEGRQADARARLEVLSESPHSPGRSPARIAYGWLLLDEPELAREWLETAYEDRDWSLVISEPIRFRQIDENPVTRSVLEHPELATLYEIRKQQTDRP